MKHLSLKTLAAIAAALMMSATFSSCDMMEEDMDDCPSGLYLTFKYDYNLQRANMFNDHVGSVTVYIFDEQGKLVKTQEESNVGASAPLKSPSYAMHVTDLAPGKYQFIALAGQRPYADMMADSRARFVRTDMPDRADMTQLGIQLDRTQTAAGMYDIVNNSLPLDTLWHGMLTTPVEVYSTSIYKPTYATIPLVRDTKKINVTLYQTNDPREMDIANYDMTITDRNSTLLYDNAVDESTGTVVYTPHAVWNTTFDNPMNQNGDLLDGKGVIGHADFMTSRLVFHDDNTENGILSIVNKTTGVEVAAIDLPYYLSQLRTSEDRYRYTEQEFLDRGYDYDIALYLVGDRLNYIQISINVLGWSKRIQFEEL